MSRNTFHGYLSTLTNNISLLKEKIESNFFNPDDFNNQEEVVEKLQEVEQILQKLLQSELKPKPQSEIKLSSYDIEEYYNRLNKHDWFFSFSDDNRVWREGKAEQAALHEEAENNPVKAQMLKAFKDWVDECVRNGNSENSATKPSFESFVN